MGPLDVRISVLYDSMDQGGSSFTVVMWRILDPEICHIGVLADFFRKNLANLLVSWFSLSSESAYISQFYEKTLWFRIVI